MPFNAGAQITSPKIGANYICLWLVDGQELISSKSWWHHGRVANFIVCRWHVATTRPHDLTDHKSGESVYNVPASEDGAESVRDTWERRLEVYFSTSELEKKKKKLV